MLKRSFAPALVVLSVGLAHPAKADACTCSSVSEFKYEVKGRSLAIAGRVVDTHVVKIGSTDNVAAIDIEVIQVLRGNEARPRLRVWDQFVGGSCSLGLEALKAGTLLIAAIDPAEPRLTELWETVGIKPDTQDLVWGTCRQPWRAFGSQAELQRFIKKEVKQDKS